jgi:hypothetical protein
MVGPQVPLERRELFSAIEADEVVGKDRPSDGHGWLPFRLFGNFLAGRGEGVVNIIYQLWKLIRRNPIVGHVRRDDLGSEAQQVMLIHEFAPDLLIG